MKKLISVIAAFALAPLSAQANMITDTVSITDGGAGSVGYTYFSQDATGDTTIETFTNDFDPIMYLFADDGTLTEDDVIASNDDGGTPSAYGFSNSFLDLTLTAGDYIVAVGDFFMSTAEAVAGINDPGSLGIGSGTYDLVIDSTANVSTDVPEPASLALMGLGLLGLGFARRKA